MAIQESVELTPREHIIMENERDEARLVREYNVRIKELELAVQRDRNQAAIELKKLEAKWSSWLRLPALIIKLPVLFLFGIAYVVSVITRTSHSKDFWTFLK